MELKKSKSFDSISEFIWKKNIAIILMHFKTQTGSL